MTENNSFDDIKVKISYVLKKKDIPNEISSRLRDVDFKYFSLVRNNINSIIADLQKKNNITEEHLKEIEATLLVLQDSFESLNSVKEIVQGYIELDKNGMKEPNERI